MMRSGRDNDDDVIEVINDSPLNEAATEEPKPEPEPDHGPEPEHVLLPQYVSPKVSHEIERIPTPDAEANAAVVDAREDLRMFSRHHMVYQLFQLLTGS